MLLRELYDFLEQNSRSGEPLAFQGLGAQRMPRCVERDGRYAVTHDVKKRVVRIYLTIDARNGAPIDRDFFLDYLYDLIEDEGLGNHKCYLSLPSPDSDDVFVYLADELWGQIEVIGDNSFTVNCPHSLAEIDKGFGAKLFGIVTTSADVGGWSS